MTTYKLVLTADLRTDLRRYLGYIKRKYGNDQAIKNIRDDFYKTVDSLKTNADVIKDPDSEDLRKRGLKRVNFHQHDYFLLFRIEGKQVEVVQMFHFLEDYENKLR